MQASKQIQKMLVFLMVESPGVFAGASVLAGCSSSASAPGIFANGNAKFMMAEIIIEIMFLLAEMLGYVVFLIAEV